MQAVIRQGMGPITVRKDDFEISTDRRKLVLKVIHDFLANRSYWARDIPLRVVKKSIENSLCFGMYDREDQIGFARVVTDFATFAYLGDVFIIEPYRGKGLGKWLIETVVGHPELQGVRLISLGTRDAHGLYERYGFRRLAGTPLADRLMAIQNRDPYTKKET